MTFGISTRPSTPVFDLLEHKYQERWLAGRREAEIAKRAKSVQKVGLFTAKVFFYCTVYHFRGNSIRMYIYIYKYIV